MEIDQIYTDSFFASLNKLTGIPMSKIRNYAKENNPFNILEHPMVVGPNSKQLEMIGKLKEFIASYDILKMTQDNHRIKFNSPDVAGQYFMSFMNGMKDKERVMVVFLDNDNCIIEMKTISEGSVGMTVVYPRDILKMALANDCSNILIAHNHPGGTTRPSKDDVELTQRIVDIFKPLDITVIDHIIVGGYKFSSMAENGTLPKNSIDIANYEPIKRTEVHEELSKYVPDHGKYDHEEQVQEGTMELDDDLEI